MRNLMIWKRNITVVVLLLCTISLVAQSKYKETFKVNDDVIVEVNTSYTNVIFETWNKNVVEVEAFVDDENLTEEEKEETFQGWLEEIRNSEDLSYANLMKDDPKNLIFMGLFGFIGMGAGFRIACPKEE